MRALHRILTLMQDEQSFFVKRLPDLTGKIKNQPPLS
jgi:hypothetical protein